MKAFIVVALVSGTSACWLVAEEEQSPAAPSAVSDQPASRTPSQPEEPIDFNHARTLLQKERSGEKLTEAEQQYLDRAKAARQGGRNNPAPPDRPRNPVGPGAPQESLELVPLTELTGDKAYKGWPGGLYGEGRNEPPAAQREAALRAAKLVQPLDAQGQPAADGRIVLLSNGMSNTTQEFSKFVELANRSREKSPYVTIVDGAQGGMEASDWARPDDPTRGERADPWTTLDQRLKQAGVTAQQVQVVWIKQARRNPAGLGEFPAHVETLRDDLAAVVRKLKERFPNLRLAYLSSRIYAGYAQSPLNPEPYSYESAFSIQKLIRDQIAGDETLNADPERGKVTAPVLLWGPYLWSNGVAGRTGDDLVWKAEDFARDGTHPSNSGRRKVAERLETFFTTEATAKPWYLRAGG